MRLEQLKYLIEVANCKSMNKAAQNLYITQPALSIAINSLEEELQYPLLKRTKKGVLLKEDGARVLQEAQMVLNTIQNWYLAKSEHEYELDGVVHIQAIPSICVAMSNTLIFELQKKYPKLSVFLHEKTPQHMVCLLYTSQVWDSSVCCARGTNIRCYPGPSVFLTVTRKASVFYIRL